jgi:ABC-type multidrug transport system ATPase subunit
MRPCVSDDEEKSSNRERQVLADLALSQVANRRVDTLTTSEHRRLMIGTQLVRDPVVLLLDEPTWDLVSMFYKAFEGRNLRIFVLS